MKHRKPSGWLGCDLDGTLAHYDHFISKFHIGEPIQPMVERVRAWLDEGREVRIFTARVSDEEKEAVIACIQQWCLKHIGTVLPVTNVKDAQMSELYDDRAVQVERNTGRLVGYSTRN